MDKQQIGLIIGSLAMILVLYFGFSTKPPKQRLLEKSRAGDVELQETQNEIRRAKNALTEDLKKYLQGLENVAEGAPDDSVKIQAYRTLSATWFDQNAYVPAGYYAEQLAEIAQTAESWAIAGSTYGASLTSEEEHLASLAMAGAVRCFENAISLAPENPEYRINLAICYAERPPESNPMQGIQSLLELNRQHPENTAVLFHLARFGMRTGQYEKAKERLKTAITLDPAQRRLHCLMAELMHATNDTMGLETHQRMCSGTDNE